MNFTLPSAAIVSQIQPNLKDAEQLASLVTRLVAAEKSRKRPQGKTRARRDSVEVANAIAAAKAIKKNRPELSDVEIAAEVKLPNSSYLSKDPEYTALRDMIEEEARAGSKVNQERVERAKRFALRRR